MKEEDRAYFEQRAEAEIELAQKADHPDVVRAHYELAGYYLDRVHGTPPGGRPNEAVDSLDRG
jgi:hypothetical protein